MEEAWYPGRQRGDRVLDLKCFMFKHIAAICSLQPARSMFDYLWSFGKHSQVEETVWLNETTLRPLGPTNAKFAATRHVRFADAIKYFYELPLCKKREVCEKLVATLESMSFPTKYDALYRMLASFGFYVDRNPGDMPCPLAAKIRNMKQEAKRLPNIIRMLVWTTAADLTVDLKTYFEMYDQSLALWTARGNPKAKFPEYMVLAHYVQHKTDMSAKKAIGTLISYGLEELYSHYARHGLSSESARYSVSYRLKTVEGGIRMVCTISEKKTVLSSGFLENICDLIKYRTPTVPDELINFAEPRYLEALKTYVRGENTEGEEEE